ncbi:MAG: hypothetical protein K2X73_11645 [Sphingomonas sp.]|uniref:hypothetical protein n=1 Tax=Sphingomonas sp. TaxID=28214 RepID=UPI0025E7038D|nr:hypothetical protein [Sphingomonas sp.]MBX9882615.1 hypothetical protein [Sphingomonas sp.]
MEMLVQIDERLLADAKTLSGIDELPRLFDEALRRLVAQEAGRKLAALGGADANAWAPERR